MSSADFLELSYNIVSIAHKHTVVGSLFAMPRFDNSLTGGHLQLVVVLPYIGDIIAYQLGGLKKEINRLQQQIYMFNAFMANKHQAIMSLFRLQSMGIREDQILNMDLFVQRYNGQPETQPG